MPTWDRAERLSRIEASNLLRTTVLKWLKRTVEWIENGREGAPPQFAIKGEAGLGKTVISLDEVAVILRDFPDLRIVYLVPSVSLGDEIAEKAIKLGIKNARVLRGRSQKQKDSAETMCAKSDIADTLAALSVSVSENLCRKKMEDGTVAECQFAATCPYLAQMDTAKQGGLVIASHQYLSIRMEPLKDIDAVITDESFTQVLCAERRIDLGRFTSFRATGAGFRGKRKQIEEGDIELGQAIESFRLVIDRAERGQRQPTLAEFEAEGFTAEHCRYLAGLEYSRINALDIDPSMSAEEQRSILKEAQVQEAFAFARVWKVLGAELATLRRGEAHGLVIERGILNPKTKELHNYIHAFWSRDPRFQETPALIIDADADPVIIKRFFPAAEFMTIAAEWRNVEVIQCYDRTGSAQAMKGERRRDEVYNLAVDVAARYEDEIAGMAERKPLLIAQKSVIDSYREAGDLKHAPFHAAHYGDIRGKDGFKDAVCLIAAGRVQPSVEQIEGLARSIWYASDEPLTFITPDEQGRLMLPNCQHLTTPKTGEARSISVSYHPDERADRVLRQVREAELMQAIARVRPVHRSAEIPCIVIVLSNIPLPIQVDRMAAWSEIVPDRFDMARLRGFIPEIAQDMADAYPDMFKSKSAVWSAASRRPDRALGGEGGALQNPYIYQKGNARGWAFVSFDRCLKTGNRTGRAWIELEASDTPARVAARVRQFLPDAEDIDVRMPAPARQEAETAPANSRDNRGFPYISHQSIILAQQSGADLPFWKPPRSYRANSFKKNSLTRLEAPSPIPSGI